MFFAMNRTPHLLQECSKLNAAPILLGISVVGLEVGYIYAYKVGWPVSIASTVQSAFLAVASFSSERFYTTKRSLSKKIIGVIICPGRDSISSTDKHVYLPVAGQLPVQGRC